MRSLSGQQRRVLSDFFSNIAVGWFAAGVISPILTGPANAFEVYARFVWGIFMAYVFLTVALYLVEEK